MFLDIPITENDLFDTDKIKNILYEASKLAIPKSTKKEISSDENRQEMSSKFGDKAFLLPKEKKFPIINPKTGLYDCKLIYAARLRSKQFESEKPEYKNIYEQASKLYKSEKCTDKLDVKIEEHNDTYDLLDLIDLIELKV